MHILSVLAEIDLMKTFVPRFEDILYLNNLTPFRMLFHSKIKMPTTISNRDLILSGFGIINKSNKNIIIPIKSVSEYYGKSIPAETKQYKRVFLNFGFFKIQYINDDTYEISNCYNVDPKVPVLPWFLLNTFIKEVNYYILENFKTQIQNDQVKVVYDKRISDKKDFYDRIKREICDL